MMKALGTLLGNICLGILVILVNQYIKGGNYNYIPLFVATGVAVIYAINSEYLEFWVGRPESKWAWGYDGILFLFAAASMICQPAQMQREFSSLPLEKLVSGENIWAVIIPFLWGMAVGTLGLIVAQIIWRLRGCPSGYQEIP